MFFNPIALQDVNPLLDIVRANPEFQNGVDPSGKIGYISYAVAFIHTFPPLESGQEASLRRECKSLMYDLNTLKIISRRQHKFFNLGEREETLPENIDWTQDHIVLEKMDGSNISPVLIESEDKVYWCSKRGITMISDLLDPYVRAHDKYDKFARKMISLDLCPCLEWCTPLNKIILDYKDESLTLTTLRHNVTGEYVDYDDMVAIAKEFDIPVVRKLRDRINNLAEFLDFVRNATNIEGFVIRFKNDMFKVKCMWYLRIHKMLDNLKFEKDVLRFVINNQIDDLKPFVSPENSARLQKFNDAVLLGIQETTEHVAGLIEQRKNVPKADLGREFTSDPKLARYKKFFLKVYRLLLILT